MSLDKIQQLVSSLSNKIENNEKLATPVLVAKITKALQVYPYDQTLGAMSRVLSKMSDNNTILISRGEFKSLYHKLYSRNTKFAEVFQQELGSVDQLATPVIYSRDEASSEATPYVGDAVLANALHSVFDNVPLKMYSAALAAQAVKSVARTLEAWNLEASTLDVVSGNEKFLILQANYETPKGITGFYIPVEINKDKIVEASVFMGNTGPQDLNYLAIKSYLMGSTGQKLNINAETILGVLNKAAENNQEVSDAELAVIRLNNSRSLQSEFQGQILGQKLAAAAVQDVKLPKSDEFLSFEEQFTSPYGKAAFNFGEDKVKLGRDHLVRELKGYGYKNPQVAVFKSDNRGIVYSVALDGKMSFNVPVKIAAGKIIKPGVMLCNGAALPFSEEGLVALAGSHEVDLKAAAVASPQFNLTPADLINNITTAMNAGNHIAAEDALNVLAHAGDDQAYARGFQLFLSGLSHKKEAEVAGCSFLVKDAKVSKLPVCGHTGLTIDKVYQDKDGNCRPLYRRGMDETYQGATFMNSKIFG